jgi:hypothetical protein
LLNFFILRSPFVTAKKGDQSPLIECDLYSVFLASKLAECMASFMPQCGNKFLSIHFECLGRHRVFDPLRRQALRRLGHPPKMGVLKKNTQSFHFLVNGSVILGG